VVSQTAGRTADAGGDDQAGMLPCSSKLRSFKLVVAKPVQLRSFKLVVAKPADGFLASPRATEVLGLPRSG